MSSPSGDLVSVAAVRDESEAQLVQGLLQTEGIPSVLRRVEALDLPGVMPGGLGNVLVPVEAEQRAREILAVEDEVDTTPDATPDEFRPWLRLQWAILLGVGLLTGIICVVAGVYLY